MFKFALALILVTIAGGALWIEQGHRVVIDAPAAAETSSFAVASACPDNDTMPYSKRCPRLPQRPDGSRAALDGDRCAYATGAVPGHRPGAVQRELHCVSEGCHRNRHALAVNEEVRADCDISGCAEKNAPLTRL